MNRRELLRSVAAVVAAPALGLEPSTPRLQPASSDRAYWVGMLERLADPVLTNLANGTLSARMPVEQAAGGDRAGRHAPRGARPAARRHRRRGSSCGADATPEGRDAATYAALARRAIARAVDPASPDFLNFTRERQPLVDAAFLAQGLLRAPSALRDARRSPRRSAAGRRARVDARDRAGLQQLAAVLRDGRGRARRARRALGSRARRLRAAPARAVVQGRRRLRRRPGVPLGLLQQLRDPPDAGRRARRVRATSSRRGRRSAPRVEERARALRRRPGAADRARRQLPADRPLDRVSLRRVSPARADGAAARAARRRVAGAGRAAR